MTDNIFATSVFFKLVIGGSDLGAFHTCSGLGAEVEMETYAEGGNNGFTWQLPGRITWTNITLTRPGHRRHDEDRALAERDDPAGRAQGRRDRRAAAGPEPDHQLAGVQGIVPVRWQGPSFDPANSQAAMETLEIAHEGLEPS